MSGLAFIAAIVVVWFLLTRYVLPRLGVKT
jgi:hypothetical protein